MVYADQSPALTIIGTAGTVGSSLTCAVFSGYGEELARNKGKVLISGQIHYYVSNSEHTIYIKNTTGQYATVAILEMLNFSAITEVVTSSVESDFSSEIV